MAIDPVAADVFGRTDRAERLVKGAIAYCLLKVVSAIHGSFGSRGLISPCAEAPYFLYGEY